MTTGNMNVTVDFNDGEERQLFQRVTVLKKEDIMCQDGEQCRMDVSIEGVEGALVTVVAQYLDDEMQLFDGIQQFASGYLSSLRGRYFFYDLSSKSKPIMISLKSSTSTTYRITGKLTDWDSYLNSDDV